MLRREQTEHRGLDQAAEIVRARAAFETARSGTGGVKSRNRLARFMQHARVSVDRQPAQGVRDAGATTHTDAELVVYVEARHPAAVCV